MREKKNLVWKDITNQTKCKRQSIAAIEEGITKNPGFYTLMSVIVAYGENPVEFLRMDKPERKKEGFIERKDIGRRNYDEVWDGTFPSDREIECARAVIAGLRKVL